MPTDRVTPRPGLALPASPTPWSAPSADPELARALRLAFWGGLSGFAVAMFAAFNALVLPSRLAGSAAPPRLWGPPLAFGFLYLAGVVLLRRGHHLAARVWLLAVASLHLVSFSLVVGLEPGTQFLALILLAAPPLFFTATERRWLVLGLVMPVVALGAMELLAHGGEPLLAVPPESIAPIRATILVVAALLVVLALESNNHLVRRARDALAAERQRADALLRNILPEAIAERLKRGATPQAEEFEDVTVLFADIVGFTRYAAERTPEEVVSVLGQIFSGFDRLAAQFGVEKIKTIGDAYMIGSGLPRRRHDHAVAAADMALAMLAQTDELAQRRGEVIALRIGIHSGRVVAGVIGTSKFAYDLWGDTVNVASRLEAAGTAGRIHVSAETHARLPEGYEFEDQGLTRLRGRGELRTYFLRGRTPGQTPPDAADADPALRPTSV